MSHFSSVDINDNTNGKATAMRVSGGKFTENGAGTYTFSVTLPANAILYDIVVHAEALWTAGTSATMKVGDVATDNGYFTGVNLKATDLLAAESLSFPFPGGKPGADLDVDAAGAQQVRRRQLTTTRVISAIVTSVGAGTGGRTWVYVYWSAAPTPDVTQVTQ